jgi:cytochrome oxidase Cu insertion factor (SCO1/SenC/PrrC family)
MMLLGISVALPLAPNCSKPSARGPLLCGGFFAYWACESCMPTKAASAKMTAQPALRYKVKRPGESAMKVNDKAPDFALPDENGKAVSLKDFRGKPVVLFFFPKADTPG